MIMTRGITAKNAFDILNAAIKANQERNGPALAFVILDNGGHVKLSHVQDGCAIARYDIALGKAYASLAMGFNSRQFYNYVKQGTLPEMFANSINGALNGKFIALPGGVLIHSQGVAIGAIGISGASSDYDEEIAMKAISLAKLE